MTFSVKLPFLCAPSEAPEALVSALVRKYPDVFKAPRQASPMKDYDLLRWLWEIAHLQGFDGTTHSIRYDGPDEWVDIKFTKAESAHVPASFLFATPDTDDAAFGTGRVTPDFARRLERERNQLRAALEHIVEYWSRDENERAMSDALWHILETAEHALANKVDMAKRKP